MSIIADGVHVRLCEAAAHRKAAAAILEIDRGMGTGGKYIHIFDKVSYRSAT